MNSPLPAIDSREAILARIREALTNPAHPPHDHRPASTTNLAPEATIPQWLPATGHTFHELLAQFEQNSVDLKTEFHTCISIEEAAALIRELAVTNNWKTIATHSSTLTDAVTAVLQTPIYRLDGDFDKMRLEACDAGITACEALVAQTGSVCLTAPTSGGRSLSVLPPHHIVLARRDQLLPDLPAVYELLKKKYGAAGYPSFISFTTGPSRTGDIERILVLGAHGPKRLTVLLIG